MRIFDRFTAGFTDHFAPFPFLTEKRPPCTRLTPDLPCGGFLRRSSIRVVGARLVGRPWAQRALSPLLFVPAMAALGACASHPAVKFIPLTAVGTEVRDLPELSPGKACRVVVVSTDDCSVGKVMSVAWLPGVEAIASRANVQVETEWLIYSDSSGTPPRWTRGLNVKMGHGALGDLKERFGISATPWTVIVARNGFVTSAWPGNALPNQSDLVVACK